MQIQEEQATFEARTREFTPLAVPALWKAMLESTHAEAVRTQIKLVVDSGDQLFHGTGVGAADAVLDWNRKVLGNARLHHLSASLVAHAMDCEAEFPPWTPTWHDFPSPFGLVVLEQPMRFRGGPISAFTWGRSVDWPGELELSRRCGDDSTGEIPAAWLITAWTPSVDTERALGFGPLVNDNDFFVPVWEPTADGRDRTDLALPHDEDSPHEISRAFKIAFDLATQANVAVHSTEPIPRQVRKQLMRKMPDVTLPEGIETHDLHPKLAAAVASEHRIPEQQGGEQHRGFKCWPVAPVLDPESGELVRRGYIAYRDLDR